MSTWKLLTLKIIIQNGVTKEAPEHDQNHFHNVTNNILRKKDWKQKKVQDLLTSFSKKTGEYFDKIPH